MDLIYPLSNEEPTPTLEYASVDGLGNEDPTTVTFTKSAGFPTSFEEWTDADGNVFVKIPTMYRKVYSVGLGPQITAFTISTAPIDETSQPYSVFVKPNGDVMPYVCIGKYTSSDYTKLISTDTTSLTMNIAMARTAATANGTGYQVYDWQFQKLFVDLALVISQKVDFNDGTGVSNYIGVYRLDEATHIDGAAHSAGTDWLFCYDPSKYTNEPTSETDGYAAASYQSSSSVGEVSKLGYDSSNPFFNFPSETVTNSSFNTYYCDICGAANLSRPIVAFVGGQAANMGLFCTFASYQWASLQHARLCYRPLSLTI